MQSMHLRNKLERGIPIRFGTKFGFWLPVWATICLPMIAGGLIMQYVWTIVSPEHAMAEMNIHEGLYNAQNLNQGFDSSEANPRVDIYLIVLGFFLLLECSKILRTIFSAKWLVLLGNRSLSKSSRFPTSHRIGLFTTVKQVLTRSAGIFLVAPLVIQTAGIKLYSFLVLAGISNDSLASVIALCVSLAGTMVLGEIFYRFVENPSRSLEQGLWTWIST